MNVCLNDVLFIIITTQCTLLKWLFQNSHNQFLPVVSGLLLCVICVSSELVAVWVVLALKHGQGNVTSSISMRSNGCYTGGAGDCPLDLEHYNTTCECTVHTDIPACDTNNYTISTIHCEDGSCSNKENDCSCSFSSNTDLTSIAVQCCSCPCLSDLCDGVSEILGCNYHHMSSTTQPDSTITTTTSNAATIISVIIIIPSVCVIVFMTIVSVTTSSLCIILHYRRVNHQTPQQPQTTQYVQILFPLYY